MELTQIDGNRTCGLLLRIKGLGLKKKTKAKKRAAKKKAPPASTRSDAEDRAFKAGATAALAGSPCDVSATDAWIAGWKSVTANQRREYEALKKAASKGMRAVAKFRWAKPNADRNQPREAGKLGGRPRGSISQDKERCACGEMTLARAKARGHKCEG